MDSWIVYIFESWLISAAVSEIDACKIISVDAIKLQLNKSSEWYKHYLRKIYYHSVSES